MCCTAVCIVTREPLPVAPFVASVQQRHHRQTGRFFSFGRADHTLYETAPPPKALKPETRCNILKYPTT